MFKSVLVRFGITASIICITIILVASVAFPSQEVVVLKAGGAWPSSSAVAKAYFKFIEMVNENGKGQLKIKWIGGPEFFKEQDLPMAASSGVLDIVMTAPGYLSSAVPAAGIIGDYPLYRSYDKAVNTFYSINEIVSPLYEKNLKIKPICEVFLAPFYLFTKKKVTSVEGIKGLKIRAHGGLVPFIVAELGGSPVTTPTTEVYTALERGLIDGATRNLAAYISFKEYEYAKYGIDSIVTWASAHAFISLRAWNKLSEAQQKILEKTGREATAYDAEYWGEVNKKFINKLKELGVEFTKLSPDQESLLMESIKQGANKGAEKLSPEYADKIIESFERAAQ